MDDRLPAPDGWMLVTSVQEAIVWLETETVALLSLDHELGDETASTGYDVLLWIEKMCAEMMNMCRLKY